MDQSESWNAEGLQAMVLDTVMTWGFRVVGAITVLVIGLLVAGWIRRASVRLMQRIGLDYTLIPFLSSFVYYGVVAFVVIAVLGLFGVPTASLIAVLGAVGLAVGLALQGTLSNFAAGVMLLVLRPIRVGDYVEVAGEGGTVRSIHIFNTELDTPDNVHIVVANSQVFGDTIKNYSWNETRRLDLVVGVSYDDDLGRATEILRGVVAGDERVLADPEPTIAVDTLADSSINILVRPWVKREDYWALKWDLQRRMKERLEAGGCTIPFPQRDVHLLQQAKQAG